MKFTSKQVSTLMAALPGRMDTHKRSLLPRILKEWSRTDLAEHLTRSTPKQIRAEHRQIDKVASRARALARALSEVESDGRFAIASQLLELEVGSRVNVLSYEDIREVDRRLSEEPKRLELLARAAIKASTAFVPLPLRQSTLIRYLVLQDLAAIYEWAMRQRAGRRVRTDFSRRDAGETYGPFWDFACAAWPMIFGSVTGLDNALKTWAKGRRRHKEVSPIIANLHMAHPQWRIRETKRSHSAIRQD